jgi:transcription elongation factor SPT5
LGKDTAEPVRWHSADIEVVVDDTYENDSFKGKRGIIKQVLFNENSCRVFFPELQTTITINNDFLKPVVPEKKDKVKIIRGEYKGTIGILIGTSKKDGVIQIGTDSSNIRVEELTNLVKIASN